MSENSSKTGSMFFSGMIPSNQKIYGTKSSSDLQKITILPLEKKSPNKPELPASI